MLRRIRCLVGRHLWEPYRNPELADSGSQYFVCSVCHKDKPQYDNTKGFHLLGGG